MIKKVGTVILFILFLGANLGYAQDNDNNNNVIDEVIWIVGDEAILKSDFEQNYKDMIASGERIQGDPKCIIPEQLAIQKLFLDQAKIDSISISDGDLARSISYTEKYYIDNLGSKEKVEEYFNMSMVDLREKLREQERTKYLVNEVRRKIVGKVNLTPSEVRKYYTQLSQDSLPYIPTSVEVQIITSEPNIPLEVIDGVKAKLRGFTDRVNAGESFATLAILYSEDGSASNGGELGFMGRAQLVPEFANVAFSLSDPTKVSNVVETEYGYHIIQLIERKGDRINVRHILLRPKVPTEEINKSKARMDTIAKGLRDNTLTYEKALDILTEGKSANQYTFLTPDAKEKLVTFEEAVDIFSIDKETRKNNGILVNNKETSTGYITTSRFTMEELPPEVGKMIKGMNVGDISDPFMMKTQNGKDVVAIVKLKSKIDGHTANVSDDFEILKQIVEGRKQDDILNKWLLNKIKATYVKIENGWQNCDFKYPQWVQDNK